MTTDITISIIQKVKDFLGVHGNHDSVELYHLLYNYRSQIHPDKYIDEQSKTEAEEKYDHCQGLLTELICHLENEIIHKAPAQLLLYKPIYDHVFMQESLELAKRDTDNLRQNLKIKENEIEVLKNELRARDDKQFEDERIKIEKMYKPNTSSLASLGIVFLLSTLMAAMTKVKEVNDFISQYSPFSEGTIKYTLFIIFVVMLGFTLKSYLENRLLRRRISQVCSTRFCVDFMSYLSGKCTWAYGQKKKFAESHAYDFIAGKKNWMKTILAYSGFPLYQTSIYEVLKNHFINHLIKNQLIEISHANGLDRTFVIREEPSRW